MNQNDELANTRRDNNVLSTVIIEFEYVYEKLVNKYCKLKKLITCKQNNRTNSVSPGEADIEDNL